MDVKQLEGNWPPAQKESPQPKYKHIQFESQFTEDLGLMTWFWFAGDCYWDDGALQVVNQEFNWKPNKGRDKEQCPELTELDWTTIVSDAIREELELSNRTSIIFETKIELK